MTRLPCLGASILLTSASLAVAAQPEVKHFFPAGGGRGQTVEVTATGAFGNWPVRAWVDEPGVVFEAAPEKGKLTARIAPDAPPGVRLVRLYDEQGASALRPFVVGTLPESVEQEPNDEPAKAQDVKTRPVVVNGRLGKRGDVDVFQVVLTKGQTLVAALDGRRRLGSPMDAVLQLATADGLVVEQADDGPGPDPRLAVTAPADGPYHVRVFAFPGTANSTIAFAGGEDFLYRLTLTTSGYLGQVLPLAIGAGQSGTVEAIGPQVPDGLRRLRVEPTARLDRVRAWHPLLAGDVALPIVLHPSLVETEPSTAGEPRAVPIPASVSGRIDPPGDEDRYRVTLRKGQVCRLRVEARAVGSPLDPVLLVVDGSGKVLVEQDDTGGRRSGSRDPESTLTAPHDGAFDVIVRDLNGQGGSEFVYRLDLAEPRPDFALALKEDRITLTPGKSAQVAVSVARRDGFAEPIALGVVGLPEGVAARPAESGREGSTAREVTITLVAGPETRPFAGPLAIVGRSGGLEHAALAVVPGLDVHTDQPWLTITPAGQAPARD